MDKAFFINGGGGRVLCAMPALEWYKQNVDENVIIVSEGWTELFLANKELRDNVYDVGHKNLFREKLIDRTIESPEPYRFNPYFNQEINLIQAFDMLINNLTDIPETKKVNLEINKVDQAYGYNLASQARNQFQKEKIVVFQPFGQGATVDGIFVIDSSGRSFELRDMLSIAEQLSKDYAVILMTNLNIPIEKEIGIAVPQANLLQWMGIINAADYFLGCDSIGQHYANALSKPATVVIGSTFPENISYPNNKKFTIIDNGRNKRMFNPFRITPDFTAERNNEDLMLLDDKTKSEVVKSVKKTLGAPKYQSNIANKPNNPTADPLSKFAKKPQSQAIQAAVNNN